MKQLENPNLLILQKPWEAASESTYEIPQPCMAPGGAPTSTDAAAKPVASDVSETSSRDLDEVSVSLRGVFVFWGGGTKKTPWKFKNMEF